MSSINKPIIACSPFCGSTSALKSQQKETGMKDKDLETAKEFLQNMLAPLDEEEKKQLLKLLLDITENI